MIIAYIGIGSNLDDPVRQVTRAIAELDRHADLQLRKVSRLFRSPPLGPKDQPDYVNAVAEIETPLHETALLKELQEIEVAQGRIRSLQKWGPRTLDLDILLYGDKIISSPQLNIPHPGLYERAFVLYPLQEIVAENFQIPGRGSLSQLLSQCDRGLLKVIED